MSYKNVQFIAYCIHTGPSFTAGKKIYKGIPPAEPRGKETADIDARINLVRTAIEQAYSRINEEELKSASATETLKIFMMPEFFFRGSTGAYEMDDVQDIISKLQGLVREEKWKDWLFVFGTIVGKSYQTRDKRSWGDFFKRKPRKAEIDPGKKLEVYNFTLVQKGHHSTPEEASEKARVVMKEFQSDMDFIKTKEISTTDKDALLLERVIYIYRENIPKLISKLKEMILSDEEIDQFLEIRNDCAEKNITKLEDILININSLPSPCKEVAIKVADKIKPHESEEAKKKFLDLFVINPKTEEQARPDDGSSIFTIDRIKFGLEVCVDHREKRLANSQEAISKPDGIVDIQLIPSCGMSIMINSIVVRDGGYVFNCDGLYKSKEWENSPGKEYFHSALFKKISADYIPVRLLEQKDIEVDVSNIYAQTSGKLHIYTPESLPVPLLGAMGVSLSLFPYFASHLTTTLSNEPILINGMKVIFDQSVSVNSVSLKERNELNSNSGIQKEISDSNYSISSWLGGRANNPTTQSYSGSFGKKKGKDKDKDKGKGKISDESKSTDTSPLFIDNLENSSQEIVEDQTNTSPDFIEQKFEEKKIPEHSKANLKLLLAVYRSAYEEDPESEITKNCYENLQQFLIDVSKDKTSSSDEEYKGPGKLGLTALIDVKKAKVFPHKNKHKPTRANMTDQELKDETKTGDCNAKYKSNDYTEVIKWENEARLKGLSVMGGTHIIHCFKDPIGADLGEMTRCIRIEFDHGHPIIEFRPKSTRIKTSFDQYIEREIELSKTNKDRLKEIALYLRSIKKELEDGDPLKNFASLCCSQIKEDLKKWDITDEDLK